MTQTHQQLLERRQRAIPRGPFNVAPIFVSKARGAELWDREGRRYIDFCGGIGVLNVGHNHPRVVDAIRAQGEKYLHTCWHVAMYEEYVELAERLNALVPVQDAKTAFFNSGAEAVENAVKIARSATGKQAVICFERGYHGRTLLTMTLTGKVHPYAAGFGPFAPEVYRLPFEPFYAPSAPDDAGVEAACREAFAHLFAYHIASDSIAALIFEPVVGEGGFVPIHPAAARVLREVTREHGILLICDEVQSGFGRCGTYFAIERYGVEPDLVTMAKSLAGGMPLSAVSGRREVMDAPQIGGLGGTYGGNPVACAAALAVLDVLQQENLCERAERIGEKTLACLQRIAAQHDHLTRPRGLGAMCAIDVVDENGRAWAEGANALVAAARESGLLLMTANGATIRTLMPLVIADDQLDEALGILEQSAAKFAEALSSGSRVAH
ncbi:MAG: 4-aminobutyrate--2-oxoglutarate transaminase [Acidobacteria bacterium]|nr:MAG: 4-aminobutyrate--2-oxoglutarate transaminase [Acidobacteriota bacterium]REK03808.1 MAG: 4-aminobutyrate--2-oxoglutarate transaminase [Acidobacteriota bacterium]